jgi:hypothetical protein
MEVAVESFEAIGGAGAARRAGQAFSDGEVEDQGQIGDKTVEREALQRRQLGERQTAAKALISERRIGKAVADDPPPRRERRSDRPRDVIASCRIEQQRFADRIPALALALQQQPADRLGAR